MRPNVSFAELTRRLTDAWLESSGISGSADGICRSVQGLLSINMVLIVIDTTKAPPDWRVDFVRKYRIPTSLAAVETLQKIGNLCDFPEGALIEQHVVEVCQKAIADCRPITGRIDQIIRDVRVLGRRIIVPDPTAKRAWCVILGEVHSLSVVGRDTRFDDVDLSILQLLREGMSAREIGRVIELSPRTVEHRVERMKARVGVRAIAPLLAMKE
ncbi:MULTISPECIES: LuxR C-terminal-related transcriptional regulator [Agrobacterium]|uniref:HTH luxR-type domain-containing protein n=1 Tax=Agrobacterium tumefaciens TaxID=358 RepID=A0AAE6BAQ2_AGRTU|nr:MULTISPECIES: LuxR C-terminal-related transcriptional regulator [Agrobacterium]QCL72246.1 hypothetical protein CFBP5499_01535 [Agrobacterium tumefaciens]QCL77817.1 hypothetical protein CFBP5877_01085 [Agrobacterium tumefaciens]